MTASLRTPAPEGEACPHDAYETDTADQPVRCVDCGASLASLASPVVPALEGEVVAWRCSGCRRLTDDLDADRATLDAGGFLSCCPERDMKPLYASPVVPVGGGEAVARAMCQDCGGHIEGWICQSCDREFRENDAGNLVFEDQPVVPVGREEIARIIEPEFFSIGRAGPGYEPHRASAFRKADAIIAALRPTDTGWIEWSGGPNPVPGQRIDAEFGAATLVNSLSDILGDGWMGEGRYRVVSPAPTDTGANHD